MTRSGNGRLGTLAFGLAIAVSLVTCYIALDNVRLGEVWSALKGSNPWWLIPGVLALAAGLGARAARWRSLFAPSSRPPLGPVTWAMMLGYFFNCILPARAGEAARLVALKRRANTSPAETLGTVILERAYDVAAVVLLFFVATPWLPDTHWGHRVLTLAIALTAGALLGALVLARYGERPIAFLLRPLHRVSLLSPERIHRVAENFTRGLAGLRHARLALIAWIWTLVAWLLTGLSCWFVMLGFHLHLPFMAGLLVAIATGLAMLLPSAPGGLGVFEAAVVLALKGYGVNASEAFSYAIAIHAVNVVPFVVAGPLMLWGDVRRQPNTLRTSASAANPGVMSSSTGL